jgi:hypothetical protein
MPITTEILIYKSKSTAAADGESGGNGLGKYRSSDVITTDVDENLFDNVSAAESEIGDTEYRAFFIKNTHASLSFVNAKVYISPTGTLPMSLLTTELANGGSETTVDVASGTDFPTSGAIFVEDEEITYTGKTGNQLTGCTSAVLHTVAKRAEHNQVRIYVAAPTSKTTGYLETIADESTEPATPGTWVAPYDFANGLSIGTLAPSEFYGVWVRRKIPVGCKAKTGISYTLARKGETAE